MDGLKYISTPRVSTKRGGGAAIVVNLSRFSLERIHVNNPHQLEVVWGLLKPKTHTWTTIKHIIVCAFYSPPNSRKNTKLLDHIISTSHNLITKYAQAGVVIGGYKNKLNISPLISAIPRLRQIVTKFTHKLKTLDVILTNLHQFYCVPVIVPPVQPDRPGHGVPSDHSVPVAHPKTDIGSNVNEYKTVTTIPLPESGIREFGQWICDEKWLEFDKNKTPNEQAQFLQKILSDKVDIFFPQKTFRVSLKDKPFITKELKQLDRAKKRVYRKQGRSRKYLDLKEKFDTKYAKAAVDHLEKNSKLLKTTNPSKAYATLKKMGAQPGDCEDDGTFTLTEHIDMNLSVKQSVEKIAQHFASISQEYPPLNPDSLPSRVKSKLETLTDINSLPEIPDYVVFEKMKKVNKPKSGVPGDPPSRLIKEFTPELVKPAGVIYRNITQTGQWPSCWKVEYGTALQKVPNPETEDQLRIISLTSYFSKVYEQFVIEWLLLYVGDQIDWNQYGGVKGHSIYHYLLEMINFILYNQY